MSPTRLFSIVLAFDLLGLLVTSDSFGHAVVSGTAINAPIPFVAVQALIVLAATRYRAAAVFLGLLCAVSVLSGFSDGSYSADLAAGERIIQLGIVASTLLLGATALRTAIRPRTLVVG
jgi:hypothetical protein